MEAEFDTLDVDKRRGSGRQRTNAIEIACKPLRSYGEVAPAPPLIEEAEPRFLCPHAEDHETRGWRWRVRLWARDPQPGPHEKLSLPAQPRAYQPRW